MTEENNATEVKIERPATSRKPKLIECRVIRDFWTKDDENGGRVKAGTILELSPEDAIDGIESGNLARVK